MPIKPRNTILLLLLSTLFLVTGQAQSDRKKALLIGIGDYPDSGGWNDLSSMNDLALVTKTLLGQGFKEENLQTLSNEKATKSAILNALRVDLPKRAKAGDIVYIQFSGHGQQAADQSGDEVDGLDECIVPYDSPKKFTPGVYEGEKLITDDELGEALTGLREKLGPEGHLVVVLDACHSGTGTRGSASARGTTEIMASKEYLAQKNQNIVRRENNEIMAKSRGAAAEAKKAPMVALFGSAQNQLNYEMTDESGLQYGSLTYAFSSALLKMNDGSSYRSLFDRIRNEMSRIAPLQQPQAEGELDMDVFNGKLLGKTNYYRVLKVYSDTELSISAGSLHGIHKGSLVGFYTPDTRDYENTKALATGRITKSTPTQSTVLLDTPITRETLESSWAYILEASLGDVYIPVGLNIKDPVLIRNIEPWLYAKPYVVQDSMHPSLSFLLEEIGGSQWLKLRTVEGYELDSLNLAGSMEIPAIARKRFMDKIREFLRGQMFKKMEMESRDIKVSFKIVPVEQIEEGMPVDSIKGLMEDGSGAKKLPVSSKIQILVHNEGIKPAFFTLIDLQPDNMINPPLLPDANTAPEELRILPGQKILLSNVFEIAEPYGAEMFKLIASSKPLDLRGFLGTRGFKETNPFEKMFLELKEEDAFQTRGGKPLSLPGADIHIHTETFIIVE